MVIFSPCGEAVGLACEALVLGGTRLLERDWLEVAGRDGLAIVPPNFKSSDAHVMDATRSGRGTRRERGGGGEYREGETRRWFLECGYSRASRPKQRWSLGL